MALYGSKSQHTCQNVRFDISVVSCEEYYMLEGSSETVTTICHDLPERHLHFILCLCGVMTFDYMKVHAYEMIIIVKTQLNHNQVEVGLTT